MQTFLSKYLAAAHLAILAVAPLVVSALCPDRAIYILGWTLVAVLPSVLCSPSRLKGESTYEALRRVQIETLRDPFLWIALAVAVYAGIRAFNVGVGIAYDPSAGEWTRLSPPLAEMPACAAGCGVVPFLGALSALLLALAARHTLGKSARLVFFVLAPFLSALVAGYLILCAQSGDARVVGWMMEGPTSCSGLGLAFAVWFLVALAGLFGTHERGTRRLEPFAAFAALGNLFGLLCFARIPTVLVVLGLAVLLLAVSWIMIHAVLDTPEEIRLGFEVALVLALPVLIGWLSKESDGAFHARVAAFLSGTFFPEGYFEVRARLSEIALDVWKMHPWRGAGLGSFAVELRFAATADDWRLLGTLPASMPNGWLRMLSECGVLGLVALALPLAPLVVTWAKRIPGAWGRVHIPVASVLLPIAVILLVVVLFLTSSGLDAGVLTAVAAALALSASSVPRRLPTGPERKERSDV